jgi:hypothetical protein
MAIGHVVGESQRPPYEKVQAWLDGPLPFASAIAKARLFLEPWRSACRP